MRQLVAAILLIAFATQIFSKGFIILDYYANNAAYRKNCVNKNKPCMHCCGRCQLKKKLQQQDNDEKQNPERSGSNKNESPLYSEFSFAYTPSVKRQEFCINYLEFPFIKEIKMPRSYFHPPGA